MSDSRTAARNGMPDTIRIRLLESDMDTSDENMRGIRDDLAGVKKILVGILVSVTTASILLVVNVLVIGSKTG